jgi:predicted DCC family thiol-disulfide oxidoreductase YuxK
MQSENPILLFDGVCNLCNGFVQFVIRRDPRAIFRYTSLQSEQGQALLAQLGFNTAEFDTVILIHKDKVYTHSDVALQIVRRLGGFWPALYVLRFIPKALRDGLYNWVARNRYRWFGKKDQCMVPTPELKSRFL